MKEARQHRVKISTTGVGKLYNLASLELEDEIQAISVLSHHWHEVGYDTNRKFSQELERALMPWLCQVLTMFFATSVIIK